MTDATQWTWSDGWILMSLYLAGKDAGAELHEILAVADATNHAIPNASELSSALTKFVRCGLARAEHGKFAVLSDHVAAIQKAYESRGGLFATGDKGLRWLKKSRLVAHDAPRVEVSEAEMEDAYQRYRKSLR